ncbi:unnamed protein product [Sphagnum troendelagicum]
MESTSEHFIFTKETRISSPDRIIAAKFYKVNRFRIHRGARSMALLSFEGVLSHCYDKMRHWRLQVWHRSEENLQFLHAIS